MPQDAKKVERLINILADFFMSIRKEAMATAEGAIDEVPPGPHPWRCAMPTQSATHVGNTLRILPLYRECVAQFTGAWPPGYRPCWKRTPWWHLATMTLSLCGGVAASSLLVAAAPMAWLLLPWSWMLTVHAARKAQLVICHHAVHGNMTGTKRGDHVLVDILSTVLLIQPFEKYSHDHIRAHHGPKLATLEDPDMQFLLTLGFRPGMSREKLWRQLYWTLVSPRFHTLFLRMRLRVHFVSAPWYRRVLSGGYAVVVGVGLAYTGAWLPWVVAWLIPIFPLYHVAALLQFVSEHRWLQGYQPTP